MAFFDERFCKKNIEGEAFMVEEEYFI